MERSVSDLVRRALEEDVGPGDITSAILPPRRVSGRFLAKSDLVLAGVDVAREVFRQTGAKAAFTRKDGDFVRARTVFGTVSGSAVAVLSGERVALNFLQRLSGVATLTRRFVELAKPAEIFDTRKTTPGLRALEKRAVLAGGGRNHRMGLYDQILIKDNHLEVIGEERLREILPTLPRPVEIEAATLDQAKFFATLPVDIILLDNFTVPGLRRAVREVRAIHPRVILEASGGVNLKTVRAIGRTGVDRISVGALTHSAPAADISLDL